MTPATITSPILLSTGSEHSSRARRVVLLLIGVVLMSLADLHMTLVHLSSAGMLEGNPLARLVISYNSPGVLVLWKLATLTLTVGILFRAKSSRSGEIGAWLCFLVLAGLMVQWDMYSREVVQWTAELSMITEGYDHRWVSLDPES